MVAVTTGLRAAAAAAPLLRAGGVALHVDRGASEQQCTVALVKNIVGTGCLTLSAGTAGLCDGGASIGEAMVLATALMVAFGGLAAWGFLLIGEACAHTGQASYVGAWSRTLGGRSSFLPAVASLLLCSTGGIACAAVLADMGTELLAALLSIPPDALSRNGVLLGVAATIFTPLCLLPSLAPIGTISYFGVAGVGVTAACMLVRLFDGSYGVAVAAAPLPSPGEAAAAIDATAVLVSAHFAPTAPGAAAAPAAAFTVDVALAPGSLLPPLTMPSFPPAAAAVSPPGLGGTSGMSGTDLAPSLLLSDAGLAFLTPRLPSVGALAFFVSLMSNAYLAHYNAPGVLIALQPDTGGGAGPADDGDSADGDRAVVTADSGAVDEDCGGSWQSGLGMRLRRAAEISDGFANFARRLGEGTQLLALLNTLPMVDFPYSPPDASPPSPSPTTLRTRRAGARRAPVPIAATAATAAASRPVVATAPAALPAPDPSASLSALDPSLLPRFRRVTLTAFAASSLLFIVIGGAGFATFGSGSLPLILSNYDPADPLASVARLGVAAAVLCEFPLLERPFRETAVEVLRLDSSVARSPATAVASVGLLCGIAASNVELDTLSALGGATGGALLIYVAPALMSLRLRRPSAQDGLSSPRSRGRRAVSPPPLDRSQAAALGGLLVVGLVCGAVGTAEALG